MYARGGVCFIRNRLRGCRYGIEDNSTSLILDVDRFNDLRLPILEVASIGTVDKGAGELGCSLGGVCRVISSSR